MKKAIFMVVLLQGCSAYVPQQTSVPQERVYISDEWNERIANNEENKRESERDFKFSRAACQIEQNKIALPAPVQKGPDGYWCSYGNCYGIGGGYYDTTALGIAVAQQINIFRNCMLLKGWDERDKSEVVSSGGYCLYGVECKAMYLPSNDSAYDKERRTVSSQAGVQEFAVLDGYGADKKVGQQVCRAVDGGPAGGSQMLLGFVEEVQGNRIKVRVNRAKNGSVYLGVQRVDRLFWNDKNAWATDCRAFNM